jgi:hypothetical protein
MDLRLRVAIIAVFAAIALAVWTFPQWRGFFREAGVQEVFPGLPLEKQADFLRLPQTTQRAYFDYAEENAANALALLDGRLSPAIDAPAEEAELTYPTAVVERTGSFVTLDPMRSAEGDVTVYVFPDGNRILRLENFRTLQAPDLHIILTRDPQPSTAEMVGIDYIDLGLLKGTVGAQSYAVPSSVDFERFLAAVLYSETLGEVISAATLR